MKDVYIVSAVRTPIGRFGGALADHSPVDMGAHVMSAALDRGGVDGKHLDLYIFGNVLRAGRGQLVPRQAAIQAGIPKDVDGYAVDMVCSSGMMAVMNSATLIRAGEADMVLAGGTESMSGAGFYLTSRARWGYKYLAGKPATLVDILERDGLSDPFTGDAMGSQTEQLAAELGIEREAIDAVAAESHKRANEATQGGKFETEIVPIEYRERRDTKTLTMDEGIRADTTTDSLAKLRPAFSKEGVLTAGNSSQISDGAAAILLASAEAVEKHGLKPIAKLLRGSWAAGEPYRFPEAPVPAVKRMLSMLDLKISDIDLFENNEAFALNSVLFHRMLDVPFEKLNVRGGAVALGHPIGASGARIIVTLIHALRDGNGGRGVAALCHGTGGGTAVTVETI
ncbi:MAG: thiolase family protein [Rhodothermales bacterium]|nr:thiolase family protein [Rhodothermales bacterium]